MIVIATNNGREYLKRLMDSLNKFGTCGHKILIVETQSSDKDYYSYCQQFQNNNIIITQTPQSNYDTGAYLWAYQNFLDDSYMFMHDSMIIKEENWLSHFTKFTNNNPVGLFGFPFDIETNLDIFEWVKSKLGLSIDDMANISKQIHYGLFGPIFYAKKQSLDILHDKNLLKCIPTNKYQQMYMERVWPLLFKLANIDVNYVTTQEQNGITLKDIDRDALSFITKIRPNRG